MHQVSWGAVIAALWIAWLVYWLVASRNVKATRWRESGASQMVSRVLFALAVLCSALPQRMPPVLRGRLFPPSPVLSALGAALVAAGLLVAVWARRHLGRNWSATITLKEDHALIRTGPYAYVRHPIYTGVLVGLVGTAIAIGEWRGVLAVACALGAIVWRVHVEERELRGIFPHYDEYRRETAALVPFVF